MPDSRAKLSGDLKWRVAGGWLRVEIMKQSRTGVCGDGPEATEGGLSSVEGGRSRAFRFARIEAWQLARAFNKAVYPRARRRAAKAVEE